MRFENTQTCVILIAFFSENPTYSFTEKGHVSRKKIDWLYICWFWPLFPLENFSKKCHFSFLKKNCSILEIKLWCSVIFFILIFQPSVIDNCNAFFITNFKEVLAKMHCATWLFLAKYSSKHEIVILLQEGSIELHRTTSI